MGAWIEITMFEPILNIFDGSHPTMGAWIEILASLSVMILSNCRTPRWVRGLKLNEMRAVLDQVNVAPHDGCVD